jgi:predicted RNA-binding protein
MCEAAVYMRKDGQEELILEAVELLETGDDFVRMVSIFGEEKRVKARVGSLSLVEHKIILENL